VRSYEDNKLWVVAHDDLEQAQNWIEMIKLVASGADVTTRRNSITLDEKKLSVDPSRARSVSPNLLARRSSVVRVVFPDALGKQPSIQRIDSPDKEPKDVFYCQVYWDKIGLVPYNELRKIKNELVDQSFSLNQWKMVDVINSVRIMAHRDNPNRYRVSCRFECMAPETLFLTLRKGMTSSGINLNWDPSVLKSEVIDSYGMHTDLYSVTVKLDLLGGFFGEVASNFTTVHRDLYLLRHWFAVEEFDTKEEGGDTTFALVYKTIVPQKSVRPESLAPCGIVKMGGYLIKMKGNSVILVHIIEKDLLNLRESKYNMLNSVRMFTQLYQYQLRCSIAQQFCGLREFINENSIEELEALFAESDDLNFGSLPTASSSQAEEDSVRRKDADGKAPEQNVIFEENKKFSAGMKDFERSSEGGMLYLDEAEVSNQRWIAQDLIKSMGSNVMQGKSLISISMPVKIFEPRSFLQRMPDIWAFAPVYLKKAAECSDPIERFKYCIIFMISGLHRGLAQKKPFNPILGETFECSFGDGSEVMLEQTSHHPPISAFQIRGPDDLFIYEGYHEYKASLGMNHASGVQEGPNRILFKDGSVVEFNYPHIMIKGILWGSRHLYWTKSMTFFDSKNGIMCELQFGPSKKSSWFGGSDNAQLLDSVSGEICKLNLNKEKIPVCAVQGSWLDALSFGGKEYWRFNEESAYRVIPKDIQKSLPSDSRNRMDLIELKRGDLESASKWKQELEELQRKDRKLRKDFGKKKH
jgi:hypothetical protein